MGWSGCAELADLPCVQEASQDAVIPEGTTVPREFTVEAGRAFIERQWGVAAVGDA